MVCNFELWCSIIRKTEVFDGFQVLKLHTKIDERDLKGLVYVHRRVH